MFIITETKTKRKRGRPKKQKPKLPKFKNELEIRNYLLTTSLELALDLKETAIKKNNIKKPSVANAKTQQYKTAISSLKIVNEILKDKQLDKLEEKVLLMEQGLTASIIENNNNEMLEAPSEDTLYKIEKLSELTKQLAELKEG